MWAWCPKKQTTFFVSKFEIADMSHESKYWVAGFMHGSEPEPPRDSDGQIDLGTVAYREWQLESAAYRKSGTWRHGDASRKNGKPEPDA
jgi:hypothetical protein